MSEMIKKLELITVSVTPKTAWTFVQMTSTDGTIGFGEATLTGQEAAITVAAKTHSGSIVGQTASSADLVFENLPFDTLPNASFSSAVMQAMLDLQAKTERIPASELLGGAQRHTIPTYANVNRRTLDRSPAGFAASIDDAIQAGFDAFKIAPFDDLSPTQEESEAAPLIRAGIDRIMAVRDALGPSKKLMVDCHWRFTTDRAIQALDALTSIGLYWFECPILETEDNLSDLAALRSHANDRGMLLAGMENAVLRQGFKPFLKAGCYDVMMPDVKYAGGPKEMMRIGELFQQYGVTFSPHNPSGPICHAHSLQICAATPSLTMLETQYDETPRFDALVGYGLPKITSGSASLLEPHHGIGVSLVEAALGELDAKVLWQALA